jgi:prolipoprotein diacylglyceryltransferase
MLTNLNQYFQYIASYLGVVLLGGAIVHMPVAPRRYAILAIIGIIIFVVSAYFEVRRKKQTQPNFSITHYVLVSFFMSIGLGMMSGSIQHFLDTPIYSSILLTIGFFISALAFYIRENQYVFSAAALRYAVLVLTLTSLLGGGLYNVAHSLEPHDHAPSHQH